MNDDLDRRALDLLARRNELSAAELAQALLRSPSSIRRRLARLARDGRVVSTREGRARRWHAVVATTADPTKAADAATTCGAWTARRELQVSPEELADLVRGGALVELVTRDGVRYDRAQVARLRGRLMRAKTVKLRRGRAQ